MIASGSNVANSDRHIGREFPLDIDRILLHSRCLSILIHVADRCANPAQGAFAVAGWTDDATWERVIERDRWVWRALRNYSVLCIADLPVVVVGCAGNRIIVRRPKHPITAADDGSRRVMYSAGLQAQMAIRGGRPRLHCRTRRRWYRRSRT